MENLNKAINEVNDILIKHIEENDHLKDMMEQHQLTIKELQKQVEILELKLKESSTLSQKKKGFLSMFFNY
uniref:Uncharacterized protein n=1 Tax=viral metagenome TaxID=1070528 RepID=A0A6C0D1B1_9ZZZZ